MLEYILGRSLINATIVASVLEIQGIAQVINAHTTLWRPLQPRRMTTAFVSQNF